MNANHNWWLELSILRVGIQQKITELISEQLLLLLIGESLGGKFDKKEFTKTGENTSDPVWVTFLFAWSTSHQWYCNENNGGESKECMRTK